MNNHTPESLQSLRTGIKEYLAADGFRPSMNPDGEIMFHFEGKVCYLHTAADDRECIRLVIVNFRPIADEADLARVTAAAHEATAGTKVIKIFTFDNDTWCTAELLLPEPDRFCEILSRTLSALRSALRSFEKAISQK